MNVHARHKEIEALKPQVLEALLRGEPVRIVAARFGIGHTKANEWYQVAKQVVSVQPYKEQLAAKMALLLLEWTDTLRAQNTLLQDREFIEAHGDLIFPLSQSTRILLDAVARVSTAFSGNGREQA